MECFAFHTQLLETARNVEVFYTSLMSTTLASALDINSNNEQCTNYRNEKTSNENQNVGRRTYSRQMNELIGTMRKQSKICVKKY